MSTDWRRRAQERCGAETSRWLEELMEEEPPTSDEIETERRKNMLNSLRSFDPSLNLEEELTLRLSGLSTLGAIPVGLSDALLRPLQESVRGASSNQVELELFGVSSGSTVLHLRPKRDPSESEKSGSTPTSTSDVTLSPADTAIRELLKLIEATEEGNEIGHWARQKKMLQGLDKFVDALEKLQLDANLSWSAVDGTFKSSKLTRQGRENLKRLRSIKEKIRYRKVNGFVTEIRVSEDRGQVKLKSSIRKNAPAEEVSFTRDQLESFGSLVGKPVSLHVQVVEHVDQIGRIVKQENKFVSLAHEQRSHGETES